MLRNRIYYSVKPFVPRVLRTAVRRRFAQRKRERGLPDWPIMHGSEIPPVGWLGWPNGKKFAVVLTHDVEGRTGLKRCLQLAELEREMGFRSCFNFVPEGRYVVPLELRDELVRDGFEVGVHDLRHDGRLYHSRREFSRNAARINAYLDQWGASGFRSGFMLHNLDWLHELKIKYDMSTFDTDPFEPQPEGRHTIFPFRVPRPAALNGHALTGDHGYIELPYTLPQDSTLFLLLRESTPKIWLQKLDWIAENGGMVLLNVHPDYMSFSGQRLTSTTYPAEFYRQFLEYLRSRYFAQYWHPLPATLARHMLDSARPGEQDRVPSMEHHLHAASSHSPTFAVDTEASKDQGNRASLQPARASDLPNRKTPVSSVTRRLLGKRGAVLLFSHYPADPRPRRAAEALAAEGAEIDLICLQENATEPKRETINGVNVLRVPLKRRRRGKLTYAWQYGAFIAVTFFYLAIRSFRRPYDLVHVHNMPDILVWSALVPKLLGARVVLDLHDPMPELMQAIFSLAPESMSVRLLKNLEKWSIAFSDHVLTVSRTFRNLFSRRSCSPEKITVVLNSPDERIFRFREAQARPRALEQPFVILYHGSLLRRNGLDLAVDALELVQKQIPSAKLVVCGASTPFSETVMGFLPRRGLSDSVEYLGPRNLEQIVEQIERCDVGIIPNHRNIFTELNTPTRILECLALGKPVIAPRAQGIQDYFGEEDLIYFTLGDAGDLARKLEYVHKSPGEVRETVKRGQQLYLAHTWTQERAQLVNAISTLLIDGKQHSSR